uniref:SnoaL-like domain-containing protein n=1 Tax=Neobodo designis TaxID=312471 RepID=A0A7S1LL72_NEODS|mmetsp:Transcript_24242/g.75045  ORF Transcript_24242/g.75045 Transcript_24242/m.75045 type:complete len:309 (+) Transcript_24242:48-974(+)
MKRVALSAVLCVAFAASVASAALVSPRTPHVSRREGNYTRSAANVIFGEFIDNIAAGNVTAAAALLDDDATGMITGFQCVELNKQGITEVLTAFASEVELLALIPHYHLVSEHRGAFWVEDTAFTPPAAGGPGYFYLPHVLFTVELNEAQTRIARVVEFFPTAPTPHTTGSIAVVDAFIAADKAKNATAFGATLADDFEGAAYPQGQIYPAENFTKSGLIAHAEAAWAVTTQNTIFTSKTYETCGYVLNEVAQLLEFTTPQYTQRAVNKKINVFRVKATVTGANDTSYAIDQWTSFYWNEVKVTPSSG